MKNETTVVDAKHSTASAVRLAGAHNTLKLFKVLKKRRTRDTHPYVVKEGIVRIASI